MVRQPRIQGVTTMAVRISSFQHSVAVIGAVVLTYAIVLFSSPVVPIA